MEKSSKILLSLLLVVLFSTAFTGCKSKSKDENLPNLNSIKLVDSSSLATLDANAYSYGSSIENVTDDLVLNQLNPLFNKDVFNYTVYVDSSLEDLTIQVTSSPDYLVYSETCNVTQDGETTTLSVELNADPKIITVLVDDGQKQSCYTITFVKKDVEISPVSAKYIGSQQIALTTNVEGGVIYYTLDGTDPSDASAKYTAPISIEENDLLIKAIVYKDGVAATEVVELNYNLVDMVKVAAGDTGEVSVEEGFYIGKFLITQDQFEMVMGYNPSYFVGYTVGGNPVESVSWYDAAMYCNKLSERGGLSPYYLITNIVKNDEGNIIYADIDVNGEGATGYRLPSAKEWEYAARGGIYDVNGTYAGSERIEDVAWYGGDIDTIDIEHSWTDKYVINHEEGHGGNSTYTNVSNPINGEGTRPVGGKYPNELGLYDMSGNVWEWTDTTVKDYLKVMQGGSWFNNDSKCTVVSRSDRHPSQSYNYFGFRIARSVD